MQTQTKFCVTFIKLILNVFSEESKLPLILKIGPSLNIKNLFLQLLARDDEVLAPPNE